MASRLLRLRPAIFSARQCYSRGAWAWSGAPTARALRPSFHPAGAAHAPHGRYVCSATTEAGRDVEGSPTRNSSAVFGPGSEWEAVSTNKELDAVEQASLLVQHLQRICGDGAASGSASVPFAAQASDDSVEATSRSMDRHESYGLQAAVWNVLSKPKGAAQAVRLIQELKNHLPGLPPSLVEKMKCRIAVAYSKRGQPDRALQIVDELHGEGLSPSVECWAALIKVYSKQGFAAKAEEVFNIMMAEHTGDLKPAEQVTLSLAVSVLVAELSRQRQTKSVQDVIFEASTRSIDVFHWAKTAFVYSLSSTGHFEEAKEVWDSVSKNPTNNWTCSALIGMSGVYLKEGQESEVIDALRGAREAQLQFSNYTSNGLLIAALSEARDHGIELPEDLKTYQASKRRRTVPERPPPVQRLAQSPSSQDGVYSTKRLGKALAFFETKKTHVDVFFPAVAGAFRNFEAASKPSEEEVKHGKELVEASVERYLKSIKLVNPVVRRDATIAADRLLTELGCQHKTMESTMEAVKKIRQLAEQGDLEAFLAETANTLNGDTIITAEALRDMTQLYSEAVDVEAMQRFGEEGCSGEHIAHRSPRMVLYADVVEKWVLSGHTEEAGQLLKKLFSKRRISVIFRKAISAAKDVAKKKGEVSPLLLAEIYHWARPLFGDLQKEAFKEFEELSEYLPHAKLLFGLLKVASNNKSVVEYTQQMVNGEELSEEDKLLLLATAVKTLCENQDPDSAAQLLDSAETSIDLPLSSYHELIAHYCQAANMDVAKPIVEYLTLSKGLELDFEVLNQLVAGYSRYADGREHSSSVDAAVSCYKQLVEKDGKLKQVNAVALLHALRARKDQRLIENVVSNLQPPVPSPLILKILIQYNASVGRFAAAKKNFHAILPYGPRYDTAVAFLVGCCAREGAVETAIEVIEKVAAYYRPTGRLVAPLFNHYVNKKDIEQADALLLKLTDEWAGRLPSIPLRRSIPVFEENGASPARIDHLRQLLEAAEHQERLERELLRKPSQRHPSRRQVREHSQK